MSTDQPDYTPGATAHIRGWGFLAGENVSLRVLHVDGTSDEGEEHGAWSVGAGGQGSFETTWHVCEDDCLGSMLRLTATGDVSSRTAQVVFTDGVGAPTFEVIKAFGRPSPGARPRGRLIQGTDGAFYGTASDGGKLGAGVVFKVNADGTGYTVLKDFDFSTDGGQPVGGLLQGADGALYGTAANGGSAFSGTVFKLNPDGTGFTVLASFDYVTTGASPVGGLVQGQDGVLYGAASGGGATFFGTVFKLNPDGTGFTVLTTLDRDTTGAWPFHGVVLGQDGALYGTMSGGGTFGNGTVFRMNTDGNDFTVLVDLDYFTTGAYVQGPLIQGPDGVLYGTTTYGGSGMGGTVFKLNPDGTGFSLLASFDYLVSGDGLGQGLVFGDDGLLYGLTGGGTVFRLNTDGTGLAGVRDLVSYGNTSTLMQGSDGTLYGTSAFGGTGYGALFKLTTDGTSFTTLKDNFSIGPDVSGDGGFPQGVIGGAAGGLFGFSSSGGGVADTLYRIDANGSDFTVLHRIDAFALYPSGRLLQGADGALYGTAILGGPFFNGAVFRVNADGSDFEVIKDFDGTSTGGYVYSAVVQGPDGMLYGTAAQGGVDFGGTVFKMDTDGTGFAVLKSLSYFSTGSTPLGGVILGEDGALYGTAFAGGSLGGGTVFKMNTDGTDFTILKEFDYSSTGGSLYGQLIQGADGALYGTAFSGGTDGAGTVFKMNTDGTGFTILKNFDYYVSGGYPTAGLIQGPDGALYGTTREGGSGFQGTVFRLDPDGSDFSVLVNFDGLTNGSYPEYGLSLGTDGNLYGTTTLNGEGGAGTLFRLVFTSADALAPTAGPTQLPAANGDGWNNTDVTVGWNWADEAGGSGLDAAHCTASTVSYGEGADIVLGATCQDLAGNTASASYTVKVDKTHPVVSLTGGPADGASYYFGFVPAAPTCAASDEPSGVASCDVSGYSTAVGEHTVTAAATDHAGNAASVSATYTVMPWTLNGFFQPVDMGGVWNMVKGGATVPLKFQVFAGSTELTSTAIVNQPLTATQTVCSGGPSDDIELVSVGTTSLRYEGQFIYSWQTPKKPGFCYVVTVRLADGTAISARFRLK